MITYIETPQICKTKLLEIVSDLARLQDSRSIHKINGISIDKQWTRGNWKFQNNPIYHSLQNHNTLRNKSDKRCPRFEWWKLQNIGERNIRKAVQIERYLWIRRHILLICQFSPDWPAESTQSQSKSQQAFVF